LKVDPFEVLVSSLTESINQSTILLRGAGGELANGDGREGEQESQEESEAQSEGKD
jgi:hypothetical protein